MTQRTCSLTDCRKATYRKSDMCCSHYMKNWRYGDPHFKQTIAHADLTGQRFGTLTAVRWANNRWQCQCDCGATKVVRTGDLKRGTVSTCGNHAEHHRLPVVGYGAVHARITTDQGKASARTCIDCGTQAEHWSYNHDDPNEMTEDGLPYSLSAQHYSPRCVPCHKAFDLVHL
jgi:hypothetical protein